MREHVDRELVVEMTKALVAVDTRNPPGGEAPIREAVHRALDRWAPAWTEVEPEAGRVSLIAEVPHPDGPSPGRPRLIVNGHLDVVPVNAQAWSRDPFRPEVVDGRLYGRGSADMKGGIAAAICALDTLERAGRRRGCDLLFHLVADEEQGGRLGTAVLAREGRIRGDACLVPEPTDLQLCVAERGMLHGYVHVAGRPGHGSRPREGISAVEHAARLVMALHAADFGGPSHPLLGRPTANVGTIHGGSALNVVAETCTIGVDRRVLPGATEESARAELESAIEDAGVEGLRYHLDVATFAEGSEMSADHPWVALVGDAVRRATGQVPDVIGMTFTTDARFVRNDAGIPAVVCGPGSIAQAHTDDEYVEVERLVDAVAAYAELYASYS